MFQPDAAPGGSGAGIAVEASEAVETAACSPDMVAVEGFCIDRFEAPNRAGAMPLVMYSFDDARAWCEAAGKRLCFEDEWQRACGGPQSLPHPYGAEHDRGVCNDSRVWRVFDQARLDDWPAAASAAGITGLLDQSSQAAFTRAGWESQRHVLALYQADASGSRAECVSAEGVHDLQGNVEEWTRRRDPADNGFSGSLRGRYWAEAWTCSDSVLVHGDQFRFYETGFRCCSEQAHY